MKHEYPQGRRVNALAAYDPVGRWLDARPFERTITSDDLLAYLRGLPAADVPRVVVLDNAGLHTSKVVKAARRALAKGGVYLYYLPPYSPELNDIERLFRVIKHHELPERTWTAAQLAEALRSEGISLSTRQTRKYLRLMGARWRRTVSTLKHKQDPERAARAERVLASLKKSRPTAGSGSPSSTSAASAPASRTR